MEIVSSQHKSPRSVRPRPSLPSGPELNKMMISKHPKYGKFMGNYLQTIQNDENDENDENMGNM